MGAVGLDEAFAAIEGRNAAVNALLTVRDRDRVAAGVPLVVKDLIDTAGIRTTFGSAAHPDRVPARSAPAVERLEAAGYTIVGKANLDEFAYGTTGENEHCGPVRNPLAPDRLAGGSSGGCAAALAAGMGEVALGTDTSGSIRVPAAFCGVVGFKPTFGAVPVAGVYPLARSFDHLGPMARTVRGCADAFGALAGAPTRRLESVDEVTVGMPECFLEGCRPGVEAAVREVGTLLGARTCEFPSPDLFDHTLPLRAEATAAHRGTPPDERGRYGRRLKACLEEGAGIAAVDYLGRIEELEALGEESLSIWSRFDLLVVPTVGEVAPPREGDDRPEEVRRAALIRRTRPFNCLGWPALAMPCGTAEEGLPASVTLVGPPRADALVLASALLLEHSLSV